ncbi:MAG: hypothetical protein RL514_2912 [Verrucomicrobiota bacterium]|jgi:hypothetical protein
MSGARRGIRHSVLVILWSLVIGHWSFAQSNLPPATVSFLDGSFLRGEVESLNSEVLKWRHPNARQSIEFSLTNLNLIRLPPRAPEAVTDAGPVCRVRLASGDEFAGRLLSLDGESFEVETWFAGRLRGKRAGLVSLAFANAGYAAFYEGPRAAEEWRSSAVGAVLNRGMDGEFFGGGRRVLQLLPQMNQVPVPQFRVVEPEPLPVAKPAPTPQELVAQLKAEIAALTDKVAPVVKQALEKRLKEVEELAAKAPVKPVELKAPIAVPPPAVPLVERQPVRANPIVPPPAPAIDSVAQTLRAELERLAGKAGVPGALPVLPPVDMTAKAAAPAARKTFTEAEVTRWTDAAEKAATVADFLKSELVTTALAEKQTSRATLDRGFAEFAQPFDWQGDAVKTARFRAMLRAEADVLGRRLLGRATFVEVPTEQAEVQAQVNAAANVLADARVRVLDALRLNNPALATALGAEGALVGPAAARAVTNRAWVFRDGAYYSTAVGTLGRECQLPTKARIEFDLAWKGQPYLRFSFFTRSTDDFDFNDGWQFYTSPAGSISSMRRAGMGGATGTSARVPQLTTKSTVRLTFLVNTETETITLLADGEQVHEWKNLGSPGPGTGITFYNYNVNPRFRLSDIRITPWDGRAPNAGTPPPIDADPPAEAPSPDSAVVEFINKDRATGTLHGIREGRLSLTTAGNKLEIPLTRAGLIAFPANAATELAKVAGVQVTLHRNERLTLALEKWEGQTITAVSPVFGRLTLKPEAIRSLRFNPTAPRGLGDEWGGP